MKPETPRILPGASPLARDLLVAVAVGLACVAARLVTLESLLLPGLPRMALLWPPTLFLLVALLLSPRRRWWLLVAASVLAALATVGDAGLGGALTMEAMNSAQALAAAWALRELGVEAEDVQTLPGMVNYLAIAVCLTPLVFSLASAACLYAGGWIEEFGPNWRVRTITNAVTALTLGPPLLLGFRRRARIGSAQAVEGLTLLALIPLAETLATRTATDLITVATPLLYLPILFFLWAALRLGPIVVSLAALTVLLTRLSLHTPILSGIAAPTADNVLTLQLFVIAMATPFLVLAAILHDYRRAEAEVRASADRHRMATTAGRVGAWDWNLLTDEILLDPSLKGLLGYADDEIANVMSDWGRHVHPGDRDRIARLVESHLERGEPFEVEHRMLHRDGSVVWFIARGSVAEWDAEGRPTRMIGTDVDVTERRHIEDAVQALRASLDQSELADGMSTLAASVAHEVSQPVAAVVANAHACLRWLSSEEPELREVRAGLEEIVSAGEAAGEVIDRTRAMFRRRRLRHEPVALCEVVRVSLDILERRLREADVEITVDCPDGLPDVLGDRVQLQQVLDNLIGNAIEAMSRTDSERSIAIGAREDGERIRLTIHDTGPGIPAKDARLVFEPFYSTRSDGLGLGLAIARSIVIAHGGDIGAIPGDGRGTTFEVDLPVAPAAGASGRGGPA